MGQKDDLRFESKKYIVTDNGHYTNGIIEIRKYPENEQFRCFFRGNEVNIQVLDEYLKEVA